MAHGMPRHGHTTARVRAIVKAARRGSSVSRVSSTCADALSVRSSPLGASTVTGITVTERRHYHSLHTDTVRRSVGRGCSLRPRCANVQYKSRNEELFADVLFSTHARADGLSLVPPIICCVRAQSAREFVTEFSGGATPHLRRTEAVWLRARALSSRPKLTSASPIVAS